MPSTPVDPRIRYSKKANKGIHLGALDKYISGTAGGFYKGVTGLPTSAYMTGRAIGHDTGQFFTHPFSPIRHSHSLDLAKSIGRGEISSYRNIRKTGDVSGPIVDALAALSGGGGLAMRTGRGLSAARDVRAVGVAAKATGRSKFGDLNSAVTLKRMAQSKQIRQRDPRLAYKRLGVKERDVNAHDYRYGKILDERTKGITRAGVGTAKLNTNFVARQAARHFAAEARKPNIRVRPIKGHAHLKEPASGALPYIALRSVIEKLKPQRLADREATKHVATRERLATNMGIPINQRVARRLAPQTKAPSRLAEQSTSAVGKVVSAPMAMLRIPMWMRPRYYIQNIGQTAQVLALRPGKSIRSLRMIHQDPALAKTMRAAVGEAQAGAIATGVEPGIIARHLGRRIPGRLGREISQQGIQGVMGHYANVPESYFRQIAPYNEFQRGYVTKHGIKQAKTTQEIRNALTNIHRQGILAPELQPLVRAEEDIGAFGRIFPRERAFMRTQLPIFYPMFKALTRLGYRFPTEHPYATATGLAAGHAGKLEQKRLLGNLPFWAQYLVPTGAGDPHSKFAPRKAVLNPANIYQLQPAADVSRQTAEMFRPHGPRPGLSPLQELGPAPWLLYGAATGHDIQTGYPLRLMNRRLIKKNVTKSAPEAAMREYMGGLPLSDIYRILRGQKPVLRSYAPGTLAQRLNLELGTGPAGQPRILKTGQTTKQYKREQRYGKGRAAKKKTHKGD